MAVFCNLVPDKNSKLFPELKKYLMDNGFPADIAQPLTFNIWKNAVNVPFRKKYNVEDFYDNPKCKFKEPTLQTVIDALNLDSILAENDAVKQADLEIGNKFDTKKVFDTYMEAAKEAIEINNNIGKVNAQIVKNRKGYSINVVNRTASNRNQPRELIFNTSLSNKLLDIVQKMGFTVNVEDVVRDGNQFSPENAEVTAGNLMSVINISHGELGEENFPEEFSHMIIAGTRSNPYTQRLLNALSKSEGSVEEILGDEYSRYVTDYENAASTREELQQMLLEEAAGKLLSQKLVEKSEGRFKFMVDNVWKRAKQLFSKGKVSDVKNAIAEAEYAAYQLSRTADTEKIMPYVDRIDILKSSTFKHIDKAISKEAAIAEKALKLIGKRMQLSKMKSPNKKYSEYDKDLYKLLQDEYNNKKYYSLYTEFLDDANNIFKSIVEELEEEYNTRNNPDADNRKNIQKLERTATLIRKFIEFKDAYIPIINELATVNKMRERGNVNLTEAQANSIAALAGGLLSQTGSFTTSTLNDLQFNVVLDFLRMYAGDNLLKMAVKGDKESADMIESLLKRGSNITFLNKTVGSLANCSDVILQLVDKAVKMSHAQRDMQLVDVKNAFTAYVSDFLKKGGKTSFLFERNSEGKPTGRFISNIDFERYYSEKKKEEERIEREFKGKSRNVKMNEMEKWIQNHTKEEVVASVDINGKPNGNDSNRVERIPIYEKPEGKRLEDILTKDELDFYHKVMFLKRGLDARMPASEVSVYLIPQKLNKFMEGLSKKEHKGKAAISSLKDPFIRRKDLGERGFIPNLDENELLFNDEEAIKKYEEQINTDLAGKPLQKIPIYLNKQLEDIDRLSEDFTSSFLAYAGMVHNYVGMNEIIDLLEITRDYVKYKRDYETNPSIRQKDSYRVMGHDETIYPTVKGTETRIADRIDKYFEMVVYGKMKESEKIIINGDTQIDTAALLDMMKAYTGALGLGFNVFAGISNELMGKIQMLIESRAKEYFNTKDLVKASNAYFKELWSYLGEFNKIQKKSKMSLMIDKFDMLDEFFNNMKYDDYYDSDLARIIGKGNIYILNNMGEHVLHVQGCMAMMMHKKVRFAKRNDKGEIIKDDKGNPVWVETNLYDAYSVKESIDEATNTKSYDLVLPEDAEFVIEKEVKDKNGNKEIKTEYKKITHDDILNTRLQMQDINRGMHGAFNDEDVNILQNKALGRMIMQFRRWMPEYFEKRFSKHKYSVVLDTDTEGFYRTVGRFLLDTLKDIKRGNFEFKTLKKNLKPWEIANLHRAMTEIGIFIAIIFAISMLGELKDKKGYWEKRMLAYQLRRLQMEIGAGVPSHMMFDNILQILQTPSASIKAFDGILNIFRLWNLNNTIESGRYKGWSVYHRDFYKAIPFVQQVKKVIDITDEDYMFAMFPK